MRRLAPLLAALGVWALNAPSALAQGPATDPSLPAAVAVVQLIPARYAAADPTHDAAAAARVRELAAIVASAAGTDATLGPAAQSAARLQRALRGTRVRLQPWPLPQTVSGQAAATTRVLTAAGNGGGNGAGARPITGARPYAAIDDMLSAAADSARTGETERARLAAAGAYALFALGPARRLILSNPALEAQTEDALWAVITSAGRPAGLERARSAAAGDVQTAAAALGDTTISRATVVADAGVIVFREGLEAVLILAAITASFTGVRRRLRRPVLLGAGLGLLATVLTYLLAQSLVGALGDGGLRLQAITGVLAIAVLLIVTNWFFHRIYWSEWIGRFNRRRRMLEQVDRLGFISGQTVGFLLLGLTSVYREGFETVLFLQNLQVSAGTGATILGVGLGLAATAVVGVTAFALERKLPYRRMLIATGVLIGLVLAIMTGTTVHTLQGLGWVPTTSAGFDLNLGWGRWLGLYPTWEGIAAQLGALAVVYGSYALARGLQRRRRRRAISRSGSLATGSPATSSSRSAGR